jgi:uncharacterized membrane protein YqjE
VSAAGGPTDPAPRAGVAGEETKSVGEIVADIARDLGTLVRKELDLAKTEVKQEATKAGKGAGLLGGAGVAGHLALLFASLTVMFALDQVMSIVWAALIVAALWGVVTAVLAASGRKKLREVEPLETTTQTLKEDARWAKHPTSSS